MRGVVVTEGKEDIAMLRTLLDVSDSNGIQFYPAGGYSAADSLARSILATGNDDVAVVVDADTRDPNAIAERKRFLENSLSDVSQKSRFLVVVVEPSIEEIFTQDHDLFNRLVQAKVTDADFMAAYYEPKKMLNKYLQGSLEAAIANLDREDLAKLHSHPQIHCLREFLSQPNARTRRTSLR